MLKQILLDDLLNRTGLLRSYACGYMCVVEKVAHTKEASFNDKGGLRSLFGDATVYESPDEPKRQIIYDLKAKHSLYKTIVEDLVLARRNLPDAYCWLDMVVPSAQKLHELIDKLAEDKSQLIKYPFPSDMQEVYTVKLPTHVNSIDLDLLQELYLFKPRELLQGKKSVSKVTIESISLAEDLTADATAIPLTITTEKRDTFTVQPESSEHGELTHNISSCRLFVDKQSALDAAYQYGETMTQNIAQSMAE